MIGCPSHADLTARLRTLSRMAPTPSPVVSGYLNTHWRDEHQRERARVFLKNELRQARVEAEAGRQCLACGAFQPGSSGDCRVCGGDTEPLELGEALVERVVATGGSVDMVEEP